MVRNEKRAAAVAVALALAVTACGVGPSSVAPGADDPASIAPRSTASVAATPEASEAPTATARASVPPPADWPRVTSDQYGFTIGHPPGWSHRPATRAWEFDPDAAGFFTAGEDRYKDVPGSIAVSAWEFDPDATFETRQDLLDWVATYCEAVGNSPCDGIEDRAIPLCIEFRDCHPALIVPFELDVYAFLPGLTDGIYEASDHIVVVAVWRPDEFPASQRYGGSTQLLLDMVRTMGNICLEADRSTCDGAP